MDAARSRYRVATPSLELRHFLKQHARPMSADDIERRVYECFGNVFPALPADQIAALTQEQVPEWDSVIHVTLLASLAEEFAIDIDFEAAQDMKSTAAAVALVRRHLPG